MTEQISIGEALDTAMRAGNQRIQCYFSVDL